MALRGIKVLEMAGLAPGPFCGLILSDFGASVIRIDNVKGNIMDVDILANGKQSLAINLKNKKGTEIFKKLSQTSDVILDTYRPGVMESLGLGPKDLMENNEKLIYVRLTGYGQTGPMAKRAGHDINYVATSGLLSMLCQKSSKPFPPINLLADFGGGGLLCSLAIAMALFERTVSGKGQVIDCSMTEGTAYLGSWIYRSQHLSFWGEEPGSNVLDGGAHFYQTYKTKDGKYMAVGAIEPKFYAELLKGLDLSEEECPQFGNMDELKVIFEKKFLEKTQKEWSNIFENIDACVTPILNFKEVSMNSHNMERKTFVPCYDQQDHFIPAPAPKLSRTPGISHAMKPNLIIGQHSETILRDLGYSKAEIDNLKNEGIIKIKNQNEKVQSKY